MWLITHLPLFNFFIFLLDVKGGKEEQSCRRRTSAKEKALGWEACTAVVACFICIIVQAGLWVLQGCFVFHSLQPWGYEGLAFPMINIQRFTSRAKACSAWIWIYMYLFILVFFTFIYAFSLFLLFISHAHAFSYQHVVELFLIPGLLSIARANLYSLVVLLGCRQIQTFEGKEGWFYTRDTNNIWRHTSWSARGMVYSG